MSPLIEPWSAAALRREIADRARVLVLFHAGWCPESRAFLPAFEAAEPEANVPFARTDLARTKDARWDEYRIDVAPTLVYFEHGEELERADGILGRGLTRADLDELLAQIDALEEEPMLPKRMHGPRRS